MRLEYDSVPTIEFVVDGQDHVALADRVMRDSQQSVAGGREDGERLRAGARWALTRSCSAPTPHAAVDRHASRSELGAGVA